MKTWVRKSMLAGLLGLAGCSMRMDWPDHRVSVSITSTQSGHDFAVDGFEVGLVGVTLKACRRWSLLDLVVSDAYAHSTTSADYLAIDAMYAGGTLNLGTMQPFDGEYCSVVLQLAPQVSGGASVHVWGTHEGQPVEVRDTRRLELELPLEDTAFAEDERHLKINLNFDPSVWIESNTMQADDPGLEIMLKIKETTQWEVRGE